MWIKSKEPKTTERSTDISGFLGRFQREQDGAMTYVAVIGALIMIVFGGIGVDLMFAELKRTKVQNTLDRAVLAAANMDNAMAPDLVVSEYFDAMGMSGALNGVTVDQSVNHKRVSADGGVSMPSNFLQLLGYDTLNVGGQATAEHGLTQIEISLILDVSGSMRGDKLLQMKNAANSFVDLMLPEGGSDMVSISVIPYNATVNLGEDLSELYTLDNTHDYSACATFPNSAYASTAIDPDDELERIAHFDIYNSDTYGGVIEGPWCSTGNDSAIIAHSSDANVLKTHINSLVAEGNTAIDLGVKWGAALLDPSARPVINALADRGAVSAEHAYRPAGYSDYETLKFMVVMTDGKNTTQYDLAPEWKTGLSDVWVDTRGTTSRSDDRYSMLVRDNSGTNNDVYYWRRFSGSHSSNRYRNQPDGPSNGDAATLYQMTNAELFSRFGTSALASDMYYQPYRNGYLSYNDYYNAYYSYESKVNGSQADTNLSTVCDAARDNSMVIYTIGVEAPQKGLDAMQDCASSPAHYFDVQGEDLNTTFSSIARSLQMLRLTQ